MLTQVLLAGNHGEYCVTKEGSIDYEKNDCLGIRPVVTMNDGVYIAGGSGTETDPYILGKD